MNNIIQLVRLLAQKKYNRFVIVSFVASIITMENRLFGLGYWESTIKGFKMLDMNFYNSRSETLNYLSELGEIGRMGYITLLGFDFILIATFFLLQGTIIIRLLERVKHAERFQWIIMVPFCKSVMDLLETISLMISTICYPRVVSAVLWIAMIATPVKWVFFWMTLLILIILLTINLFVLINIKTKNNEQRL